MLRCLATLTKSSTNPSAPYNNRINKLTHTLVDNAACHQAVPMAATMIAPMKTTPPMVGVPVLASCHLGPSSRIVCPSFF